jgi:tetraacyldisaccharide 4'-kinase
MKTPRFWSSNNIISYILIPLSWVYLIATKIDGFFTKKTKINKTVICIGNLIAGGSGKTPTAIAIGKIIENSINKKFVYLTRGYKGKKQEFLSVNQALKRLTKVSDEAILLNEVAQTFIARNRAFGAKKIEQMKEAEIIILDDGLQNNNLSKDIKIIVIDGFVAFGNCKLIPAGPLRQNIKSGLAMADLVIIINEINDENLNLIKKNYHGKIIFAKTICKNLELFDNNKNYLAFCGLAYPDKFFNFLTKQNLSLIEKINFADHYYYSNEELKKLITKAEEQNCQLITTKKDWVKFPSSYQKIINYLDIEVEFADQDIQYIKSLIYNTIFRK